MSEGIPDLYPILGLNRQDIWDSPQHNDIIKKNYRRLAKKYHPDKNSDIDTTDQFELVQYAYEILSNQKKREEYYDRFSLNTRSMDHNSLRNESRNNASINQVDTSLPKNFNEMMNIMDMKHGITRNHDTVDTKKRYGEMETDRRKLEAELSQKKRLFKDGEEINPRLFNAAFDKISSKTKKEDLIPVTDGPFAYNMVVSTQSFGSVNDVDNLYDSSDVRYSEMFGVDESESFEITDDEYNTLEPVSYFDNHNKKDENYYKSVKSKLQDLKISNFKN